MTKEEYISELILIIIRNKIGLECGSSSLYSFLADDGFYKKKLILIEANPQFEFIEISNVGIIGCLFRMMGFLRFNRSSELLFLKRPSFIEDKRKMIVIESNKFKNLFDDLYSMSLI